MNIFLSFLINLIFILFPSLLYTIYVAKKQTLKKDENEILLDLSLLISLLLIILYNKFFFEQNIIMFPLLIMLISLVKKRIFCSFLICVVSIEYIHISYEFNYFILIFMFLGIYIIYYFSHKIKEKYFTLFFWLYTIIALFSAFYLRAYFNHTNFLLYSIVFILTIFLIQLWLKKINELIKLQNILKDYQKEEELKKSLFKITHEIKNPLAVVKGYLSMINLSNTEKTKKFLNIVDSEIERTINLLHDFMQFSKIEIEKKEFDFNILLEETKNILIPLFNNKSIAYKFKAEKQLTISADYNRIKQVIINVIKNSIEASKDYGIVNITCYKHKNLLNIIVKDYGYGMSPDVLNNLFTPFFTTKEKGTGLGICLSKEIVEAHKGRILYTSNLNKGTTAKIVLPLN